MTSFRNTGLSLTALRLSVALVALLSLGPNASLAMLGGSEAEAPRTTTAASSSQSRSAAPDVRDTAAQERAERERAQARVQKEQQARGRAALMASVALAELQADTPEDAAALREALQEEAPLTVAETAELNAKVAREREKKAATPVAASALASESAYASTSSTAAAAAVAEVAPVPRRKLNRQSAVDLSETSKLATPLKTGIVSRTLFDEARIARPDLGNTDAPTDLADIVTAFNDRPTEGQKPAAGFAKSRRIAVLDAIADANKTRASLKAPAVGQLPRDLARAFVAIANTTDGEAQVRQIADPVSGINTQGIDNDSKTEPILHVAALDTLIAALKQSAKDYKEGSDLHVLLQKAVRTASEDRRKLVEFLKNTAESYPRGYAEVQLQSGQLSTPVGSGMTSAPRRVRYDFGNEIVRQAGPFSAVFKQTVTEVNATGGLEQTGVVLNVRGEIDISGKPSISTVPMRLDQRSVATRKVADVLGLGDLVVDTRIAGVAEQDGTMTLGVVMELAPGTPGIESTRLIPAAQSEVARFQNLEGRFTEAEKMLNAIDSGLSGRPSIQLTRTSNQTGRDPSTWSREEWEAYKGAMTTAMEVSGVAKVVRNGKFQYLGLRQERTATDAHLANPDLRRQLSNAEWLDLLCGQVDRHPGNYYIDVSGPRPVMKLIDNDFAFGPNNAGYMLHTDDPVFMMPSKPRAIDSKLYQRLMSMNGNELRAATDGLLSAAEQDALVDRLAVLQDHIRTGNVTLVYAPGERPGFVDWSSGTEDDLFRGANRGETSPQRGERSYYGVLKAFPVRGQ